MFGWHGGRSATMEEQQEKDKQQQPPLGNGSVFEVVQSNYSFCLDHQERDLFAVCRWPEHGGESRRFSNVPLSTNARHKYISCRCQDRLPVDQGSRWCETGRTKKEKGNSSHVAIGRNSSIGRRKNPDVFVHQSKKRDQRCDQHRWKPNEKTFYGVSNAQLDLSHHASSLGGSVQSFYRAGVPPQFERSLTHSHRSHCVNGTLVHEQHHFFFFDHVQLFRRCKNHARCTHRFRFLFKQFLGLCWSG